MARLLGPPQVLYSPRAFQALRNAWSFERHLVMGISRPADPEPTSALSRVPGTRLSLRQRSHRVPAAAPRGPPAADVCGVTGLATTPTSARGRPGLGTSPRCTSARSYSRQFPTDTLSCISEAPSTLSRIVRQPRQQDQPVDDARRSEGQEPCAKAATETPDQVVPS